MLVIKNDTKVIKSGGVFALGNFDGVHLGHKEIIDIIKINPEAEASGVIGSIEEDATSSMLSDLVFTPFDIPNDRQLRGKLILDCIKRIELDSIKDLKRLINLKLSKDVELTDKDEKELLNELKDLIDREKQLQS